MKQFLFCYFALFSLANAKSTPPPPGGDGDDNDDDASGGGDDHAHCSGPLLEACNIGTGEERGMLDDKVIDEVPSMMSIIR